MSQTSTTKEMTRYAENHRPHFHFSPPANWLSDPNGLIHVNGVYHLFFQHNPYDKIWGHMHWGHATSSDLMHWANHPPAIVPGDAEDEFIFSGGVVFDEDNSSGLGESGKAPLLAFYTMSGNLGENQRQCVSYSTDDGHSWERYTNNPILINPGYRDFRDPKVVWYADGGYWIMILAAGRNMEFYRSDNLLSWTYLSSFGELEGAHGGEWECPDLFRMTIEGTQIQKWVLLVSLSPGGPNGGSATQYFIGEFDGSAFTSSEHKTEWLDWGPDNYASTSWEAGKTELPNRVLIGWMSNWLYANTVPTDPWRGQMTLPRTLKLKNTSQGVRIASKPWSEFEQLRKQSFEIAGLAIDQRDKRAVAQFAEKSEILLSLRLANNVCAAIELSNSVNEAVTIYVDRRSDNLRLDRWYIGRQARVEGYALAYNADLPDLAEDVVDLRLIIDRCSIEVFALDGTVVMTALVFSHEPLSNLSYVGVSGYAEFGSATIFEIDSVYPYAQTSVSTGGLEEA